MLEKDEEVIHDKIVALQRDYISARREFVRLREQAKEKKSELSAVSLELKTALKDLSIGDKSIKNTENEIAVLRKKIFEMDDDLEFVDQELRRTNDEVEALTAKKNDFAEKTAAMTQQLQQSLGALRKREEEFQETSSFVETLKAQKSALSMEISEMLSKAVVQKEKDEKELDAFSMNFGKIALEREDVKGLLDKSEEILSPLKEEITDLEGKCAYLEEVVLLEKEKTLLEADLKKLEEETQTTGDEANSLEDTFSRKKDELESLLTERIQKEALVETLSKEVQAFDDLAVKAEQSEERLREGEFLIEQKIADLQKRFAEQNGYALELVPGL